MNKRLIFTIVVGLILTACSKQIISKQVAEKNFKSAESEVAIPSVPNNWKFLKCYEYKSFKGCDFAVPLPDGSAFDAASSNRDYIIDDFWIAGSDFPGIAFEKNNSLNHDLSLEQLLAQCTWIKPYQAKFCPKPDYVINRNQFQIARRKINGRYDFFLRTPKMTIQIIGGGDESSGGGPNNAINEKNLSLVESALLNIQITSSKN